MAFFCCKAASMHNLLNVIFLALVQGLTEFLPVSSSGHLVIAQRLLGVQEPGIRLEIWLHIGTLVSIVIFYRQSIINLIKGFFAGDRDSLSRIGCIVLSTIPAGIFYFLFHERVDTLFKSAKATGGCLVFTGVVLIALRWVRCREGEITPKRALLTGLAQAIAVLPGISRSGMTISAARASGICPVKAAEFSFLMVIPLIIGAAILDLFRMPVGEEHIPCWLLAVGVLISAVVGWAALTLLVRLLKDGRFWMFGIYCVAAGVLALTFF